MGVQSCMETSKVDVFKKKNLDDVCSKMGFELKRVTSDRNKTGYATPSDGLPKTILNVGL